MNWDKDVIRHSTIHTPVDPSITKDLESKIRYQVEMIEQYLGDVSRGVDQTWNLQFHLDGMKKAFEKIEEIKHITGLNEDDIEEIAELEALPNRTPEDEQWLSELKKYVGNRNRQIQELAKR